MSTPTIYHNPKCSKSRKTLELLQQQGIDTNIVEYLKTPPDEQQLTGILEMLGLQPRQLMRTNEPEYKEQKLDNPDLSREQLVQAMVQTPKLIQRPIVVSNGKAAIGRPPESVLEVI